MQARCQLSLRELDIFLASIRKIQENSGTEWVPSRTLTRLEKSIGDQVPKADTTPFEEKHQPRVQFDAVMSVLEALEKRGEVLAKPLDLYLVASSPSFQIPSVRKSVERVSVSFKLTPRGLTIKDCEVIDERHFRLIATAIWILSRLKDLRRKRNSKLVCVK